MKNKIKNKKAQVTIFIIIGLIILISIFLFIFFKTEVIRPKGISLITEEAPSDFKPVQSYITGCLEQTATEAMFQLGRSGGHTDLTDPETASAKFKFFEARPTDGDALVVSAEENYIVPYWYYMKSDNKCGFCDGCGLCYTTNENILTLEDMQNLTSRYIEKNIYKCIKNFEIFREKNINVEVLEEPVVETFFAEKDIVFQLKFPVTLNKGDLQTKLQFYNAKIPLKFKDIYYIAKEVADNEGKNRFLEKILVYLISVYSGESTAKLPPFYLSKDSYVPVIWLDEGVKLKLQELLSSYIPLITIENTKNAQAFEATEGGTETLEDKFYQNLFLTNEKEDFKDYSVRFFYKNWPIYMHVTPSKGGVIEPSKISMDFGKVPIASSTTLMYNFYYDIAFPVLVEIRDDSAFDGKGYSFFIALESNIKDNKDILRYVYEGSISDYNPEDIFEITNTEKITSYTGFDENQKPIEKNTAPPKKIFFCDNAQRIGAEIDLRVKDFETKEPIKDAGVYYNCNRLGNCLIGSTDASGKFKGMLPICLGGALKISALGYFDYVQSLDSEQKKSILVNAKMIKPYTKKVNFRTINMEDIKKEADPNLPSVISSMRANAKEIPKLGVYQVILMLERQKNNPFEKEFVRAINLENEYESSVELVQGDYNVKIMLLYTKEHIIPKQTKCAYSVLGICFKEYTIPEIKLEQSMQGITTIDENNMLWKVKHEELADPTKKLVFYIPILELPKTSDDLGELGKLEEYNNKYSQYFRPAWLEI